MKLRILPILAGLIAPTLLSADPDSHGTLTEERFFASSPTAYAILRTETETIPDDGGTRTRTWLDEYSKEAVEVRKLPTEEARIKGGEYLTKLEKSTLLLDVSDHTQPSGNGEEAEPVASKDPATFLANLLLRYPGKGLTPLSPELAEGMRYSDSSFFIHYRNQTLVSGSLLRARMGGDRMGDAELMKTLGPRTVSFLGEDENCLFLTISATAGKMKQTRVFCIVPAATKNLHTLSNREPHYLSCGRFETKEEALQAAKALREKLDVRSMDIKTGIEVWAHDSTKYSRTLYFVVLTNSTEMIRSAKVGALQDQLGTKLLLIKSDSLSVLIDEAKENHP